MINTETLQEITDKVASLDSLNEEVVAILKGSWPDLRFTLCNDDDMPARLPPVLQRETFNLYLVNGSEHCLSLTDDSSLAIGVVIAEVDEE